jgi:hypothetical protein
MTKRPLKPALRQHFEQRALSADQLKRLEALLAVEAPKPAGRRQLASSLIGWPAAAAIAALFAVILLLPLGPTDDIPMTQRIATEVAHNHIKLKPLDVVTDNMEGIRRYFSDLEFLPVKSQLLAGSGFELLGGRYCSIQSVPAAQLRVSTADQRGLQTLYQSEYHKDVFGPLPVLENGEIPVEVGVKGIVVRIWVEKGLLFALTQAAELEAIQADE